MVKIIFSDFDETLLNYHSDKKYFDDYQVDVLRRIREQGIEFCIVTGRNAFFFHQFSNILPYVSYILASNGSCIYDVKNKKFIYQKFIGVQEVSLLFDYIKDHHYDMYYNSLGEQIYNDDNVNLQSCEQIILSFHESNLENVLEDIKEIPYVNYNNICRHGTRYTIDVNNYLVSKGNAVKYLCDFLDVDLNDTIGFGDSDNDVSMFELVGKSIAVGNATDKMKTLASAITLSSEENGVFRYIDRYILR